MLEAYAFLAGLLTRLLSLFWGKLLICNLEQSMPTVESWAPDVLSAGAKSSIQRAKSSNDSCI